MPSPDRLKRQRSAAGVVSCGVLVMDGGHLLLGHATRSPRWDVPKGVARPGEDFSQAALRELREETGLEPPPSELIDLGRHPYLRGKDLFLFAWLPETLPDPTALRCTSTFTTREGKILPELDRFAIFPWEEAMERVGASLAGLLRTLPAVAGLRKNRKGETSP
jgi:8-oxo-dGTP pyrophosphatase MutT (NUDIX family)